MLVKLTQMYFDGRFRHRAGAVIDLPAGRVPKSAKPVDADAEPEAPLPEVQARYIPGNQRWRLMAGKVLIQEFEDKTLCQALEEELRRDPDALRERLKALETADAVS